MASATIGTLGESSLHAAVKQWLMEPGDLLEAQAGGWVIDIVRGDLLIEVQTGSFSSVRSKLEQLLEQWSVRLVYPVAVEKRIVTVDKESGELVTSRRSPKRGRITDIFRELVSIPHLIAHPNFELEVLLVKMEEVRCADGKGSWRRRGVSILDRRLVEVRGSLILRSSSDFRALIPDDLHSPFTAAELGAALGLSARLGQRAAYCLSRIGAITQEGKRGRAYLYRT